MMTLFRIACTALMVYIVSSTLFRSHYSPYRDSKLDNILGVLAIISIAVMILSVGASGLMLIWG